MNNIEPRYLTQKQAEQYTGMGRVTLWSLVGDLVIRERPGERRYYDRQDIDRRMHKRKGQAI
jgi:hypothetical protein